MVTNHISVNGKVIIILASKAAVLLEILPPSHTPAHHA